VLRRGNYKKDTYLGYTPVFFFFFFFSPPVRWDPPFLNGQPLLSDPHFSDFQIQGEGQASSTIRYKGVLGTITTLAKTEGLPKLYSGLPAGIQRQISFASLRIGLYDSVQEYFSSGRESKEICIPVLHLFISVKTNWPVRKVCVSSWTMWVGYKATLNVDFPKQHGPREA
jgi:hypothetical protein